MADYGLCDARGERKNTPSTRPGSSSASIRARAELPPADTEYAVGYRHACMTREHHFDIEICVTRKGWIQAGAGLHGIIPGSMGARSRVVLGGKLPLVRAWRRELGRRDLQVVKSGLGGTS